MSNRKECEAGDAMAVAFMVSMVLSIVALICCFFLLRRIENEVSDAERSRGDLYDRVRELEWSHQEQDKWKHK